MKQIILIAMLSMSVTGSIAQSTTKKIPSRKNEIGFGYRIPTFNNFNNEAGIDLMFKHYTKPSKAFRIMAGYQNLQFRKSSSEYKALSDTLTISSKVYDFNTFFIGGGLQLQRHFYKRIILTAAVDTRFHMGSGDLNAIKEYKSLSGLYSPISSTSSSLGAIKAFKWDLYPSIGAKFEFSRINFGLELTAQFMQYYSFVPQTSAITPLSLFDLDLGNAISRIFINYRF